MKLRAAARLTILLLLTCALLLPAMSASAQNEWADGTYTANYLVLKADDDSVSIANDYWEKPATVVFDKGKTTIRLTLNHSDWVTEFKTEMGGKYSNTKVVGTNKTDNKRTVEFNVSDITKPIMSKIKVFIAEIDYDHGYTIRLVFQADSFKLVKAAETPSPSPTATASPSPSPTATPEPAATAKPEASALQTPSSSPSASSPAEPSPVPTASPASTTVTPAGTPTASATAAASASPSASPANGTAQEQSGGGSSSAGEQQEEAEPAAAEPGADSEPAAEDGSAVEATVDEAAEVVVAGAGSPAASAGEADESVIAAEAPEAAEEPQSSFFKEWRLLALIAFVVIGAAIVWIRRGRTR